MPGGYRPNSGRPAIPDFPDILTLKEHLMYRQELHLHRHRNERYKKGHIWSMVFTNTSRCNTDQCLKIKVNVI